MITIESDDILDTPASSVFALLTDLEARPTWMRPSWMLPVATADRVTPPGPARLGTSLLLNGAFGGESGRLLFVTELEQNCRLTLSTTVGVENSYRESYHLKALSEGTCRLYMRLEVGGIPRFGEFFMRQPMQDEQPQIIARLISVLARRSELAS